MIQLRPAKLDEFKGKNEIKQNIRVYIDSCNKNKNHFDHTLIYGLPGTGKTTLSMIIAKELGRGIKIVQGGSIQKNIDITNLVLSIKEGDVIFIDEIHSVNQQVIELLYTVMEDFALDISLGKEFNAKVTRVPVPKFTLIGATTMLGKIPLPLEERFGIIINLKNYDIKSLIEILTEAANKLSINLSQKDIELIARNSKNIPRNAIRIIKRVYDFRTIDKKITVKEILEKLQIARGGLETDDVQYLKVLEEAERPVGIKTMSQIINVDPYTIEVKIEPFLMSMQYITKTNTGRIITEKGRKVLLN